MAFSLCLSGAGRLCGRGKPFFHDDDSFVRECVRSLQGKHYSSEFLQINDESDSQENEMRTTPPTSMNRNSHCQVWRRGRDSFPRRHRRHLPWKRPRNGAGFRRVDGVLRVSARTRDWKIPGDRRGRLQRETESKGCLSVRSALAHSSTAREGKSRRWTIGRRGPFSPNFLLLQS